jgi:hypothetical protein
MILEAILVTALDSTLILQIFVLVAASRILAAQIGSVNAAAILIVKFLTWDGVGLFRLLSLWGYHHHLIKTFWEVALGSSTHEAIISCQTHLSRDHHFLFLFLI